MTGVMASLLGASSSDASITISDWNIDDVTAGARTATAGYRLTSGGNAQSQVNATFTTLEQWCTPTAQAVNYEVYVDVISGALSSGTSGSWLALSSTRTWACSATAGTIATCEFTASIRRVGVPVVLDTATITLTADATF